MNEFLEVNEKVQNEIDEQNNGRKKQTDAVVAQLDRFKVHFSDIIAALEFKGFKAEYKEDRSEGIIYYKVNIEHEANRYGYKKPDEYLVVMGDVNKQTITIGNSVSIKQGKEYTIDDGYNTPVRVDALSQTDDNNIKYLLKEQYEFFLYKLLIN